MKVELNDSQVALIVHALALQANDCDEAAQISEGRTVEAFRASAKELRQLASYVETTAWEMTLV